MPRRGGQSRRCAWVLDEGIPCGATRIEDVGIAFKDAVAEMILAQEPPDVLSLSKVPPGSMENRTAGEVGCPERPGNAGARTGAGHWNGGIIVCKIIGKRTPPVRDLHVRKYRVTLATTLTGKTAAETIPVMLAVFARIEPALRKSITFANDPAPGTPKPGPPRSEGGRIHAP